jgi:hypothetical protein
MSCYNKTFHHPAMAANLLCYYYTNISRDLCPRYAWEVKQIANYDAIANDPNHPMAQQQQNVVEKYGGSASPRGIVFRKRNWA